MELNHRTSLKILGGLHDAIRLEHIASSSRGVPTIIPLIQALMTHTGLSAIGGNGIFVIYSDTAAGAYRHRLHVEQVPAQSGRSEWFYCKYEYWQDGAGYSSGGVYDLRATVKPYFDSVMAQLA